MEGRRKKSSSLLSLTCAASSLEGEGRMRGTALEALISPKDQDHCLMFASL